MGKEEDLKVSCALRLDHNDNLYLATDVVAHQQAKHSCVSDPSSDLADCRHRVIPDYMKL